MAPWRRAVQCGRYRRGVVAVVLRWSGAAVGGTGAAVVADAGVAGAVGGGAAAANVDGPDAAVVPYVRGRRRFFSVFL